MLLATAVAFVCFCLGRVGHLPRQRRPRRRGRPTAPPQAAPSGGGRRAVASHRVPGRRAPASWRPWSSPRLQSWPLLLVVGAYVAISLAYCFGLKNEPLIDIVAIASGFILRAVAGGVAAGIPLSEWFILATSFGSLFMAAGKRYAEINDSGIVPGSTRASLASYSATYIRFVWTLSAGVLIMTYGLWAFDRQLALSSVLPVLSVFPFVVAVLRYAMHVDGGAAGEPEDIVARDHWLQSLGVVWVVLVAWPLVF